MELIVVKAQYVVLTGSKNNAGDYLIKYRAMKLFVEFREDRKIIDYNAWEKFDTARLEEVNNSMALILLGGPALQSSMRPEIYPLIEDLAKIKVPIILMGIGWKSIRGNWEDTYSYPLSDDTLALLRKIDKSGYQSSVRDYHTLNMLHFKKIDNILMTGCPAYYDFPSIGKAINISKDIKKVAFSLGVSFIDSHSMKKQMQDIILQLKERFKNQVFEMVFHHSLEKEKFLKSYNHSSKHVNAHNKFAQWLVENDIAFVDISGSAENLIKYYKDVDLHIGYRVHAHIYMNSISKFSILLTEDGRGRATKDVIGGIVINGFLKVKTDLLSKILSKLIRKYDRYKINKHLIEEVMANIIYEEKINFSRIEVSRKSIDTNLNVMKQFLMQLP
jgi:hypothetical protein